MAKKAKQTGKPAKPPRTIIIGNWKMNGLKSAVKEIKALDKAAKAAGKTGADMMICPPATLIGTGSCRGAVA